MRVAAFLAGLLTALPAFATTAERATLAELVGESQLVVLGTVGETESFWSDGRILSRVRLTVEEVWVGAAETTQIEVITLGGRVGDIGQKVAGAPRLATGDRVVLCLEPNARAFRVVELAQGTFFIEETVGPDPRVTRRLTGMRLVGPAVAPPATLSSLERVVREIARER